MAHPAPPQPVDRRAYPWLVRATAFINFFYFYCVDADFGPFFLKFSSYFPYTAKLCINGNEWAKRQAAKAGIGFSRWTTGSPPSTTRPTCPAAGDLRQARPGTHRRAAAQMAGDPAPPVHRRRRRAAGYRYELSILQAEFSLTQMLDRPVSGRIFFEQVHARQPRHRPPRPGQPDLRPAHHPQGPQQDPGPVPHPGHHRRGHPVACTSTTRHTKIKQYHKEGRALRTETTINDTRDFGLAKRLTNLPALRQIGFTANRRLLGVQRLSHDPIRGAEPSPTLTAPILTDTGTRIPGLRFGDPRAHALLQALLIYRLLPHGFTNRELRTLSRPCSAPRRGPSPPGR